MKKLITSFIAGVTLLEVRASSDAEAVTAITDIGGHISSLIGGYREVGEEFCAEGSIEGGLIMLEHLKRHGWVWA